MSDSVALDEAEPNAMLSYIKKQTVTITIGVSFFVFGFFIAANLLKLSERDVLVGLVSGAIGGITMLAVSLARERRSRSAAAWTA